MGESERNDGQNSGEGGCDNYYGGKEVHYLSLDFNQGLAIGSRVYYLILERLRSSSVDGDVQEKSDNVYKMSISSCCFKPEVVLSGEVVFNLSEKAHGKEGRANNDMEAVEASGYKEGGAVNPVGNSERGFIVF